MSDLYDYATAQCCDGFEEYFAKRSEYLRKGTKRDAAKAKSPAIAQFIRKEAMGCAGNPAPKKKDKKPAAMSKKKDGSKEEKTAKSKFKGVSARVMNIANQLKEHDAKDGKKEIEKPVQLAKAVAKRRYGTEQGAPKAPKAPKRPKVTKKAAAYPHLTHLLEKRAYGAMIQPDPETHEILRKGLAGGTRGGLVGLGLGSLLGGGLGGYAAHQTQGVFDEGMPIPIGVLLGALQGGALGAGTGAAVGGLGGSGAEWVRQLAGGEVPPTAAPKNTGG